MNEFGDQIYNIDGSRRTIRRGRNNYNTQSRSHTVRSYATNVKEDKTNKGNRQGKGNERFNRRDRDGGHKEQSRRNRNDKEDRGDPKKSQLPCRVCSETTHSNLLGC